ncbi:MAG: FAD:protein FMN transferase [Pseudomonadota bacterium]
MIDYTVTVLAQRKVTGRAGSARIWLSALVVLSLALYLPACGGRQEVQIAGRTMGTTYHIKVVARKGVDLEGLKRTIDERLEEINRSMSTYRPDSEISRFNALAEADMPVVVSRDFLTVLTVARRLYEITGGAWDGTLKPVINLWGFGHTNHPHEVPPPEAIAAALADTGFDNIRIHDSGAISKKLPRLTLDLASVAKGYGVDVVAGALQSAGYRDFLVEIGGEVVAAGRRQDGRPWRVGINLPDPGAPANRVYHAMDITDHALATSGDYRNFFIEAGHRYTHILDPRTGRPVENGVVSVSIYADNCTLADGLATGVTVMGAAAGLALLERMPGVEGFIIEKGPDGGLRSSATSGFPASAPNP